MATWECANVRGGISQMIPQKKTMGITKKGQKVGLEEAGVRKHTDTHTPAHTLAHAPTLTSENADTVRRKAFLP